MSNTWQISVDGEGDELETNFQFADTDAAVAAIKKLSRSGRVTVRRVACVDVLMCQLPRGRLQ